VTSLFIVFAASLIFGSYSFFAAAVGFGQSSSTSIEYWLGPVIAVAEMACILAALKFMFDIPNNKSTINAV